MSTIIEQPRYSCAISAQQTVLAIPGAHPILHSGPGCSERSSYFSITAGGSKGFGYTGGPHISSTNSTQKEIVFGGIPKLRDTISGALKVIEADLFVVLTGCTAEIVGDDILSVTADFASKGYPVVGAETAGFKGNVYYGYKEVVTSVIEQYVGDATPNVRKGLVNVFSVVPYQNPFWQGDLQEIKRILEKLGLEVNILFGAESAGVGEWKDIPNAEFNLLLSPWVGKEIVELLKRKYDTPFLEFPYLPVGAQNTSDFLRKVGEFAGVDTEHVEKVIAEEEKIYYTYFGDLENFLTTFNNEFAWEYFLVADSNYALGVSSFLTNELGLSPKGIYITDDAKKSHQERILKLFSEENQEFDGTVIFENDGGKLQRDLKSKQGEDRELILGSSWEKFLARDTGKYYTALSLPLTQDFTLNTSYAGYLGGITLIKEITRDIFR